MNRRRTAYETVLASKLQSTPQISTLGTTRTCDRLLVSEPPLPLGHEGSKSGRQESNLPPNRVSDGCLAARPRPEMSALYGTRTRLACSTGRSPHPLRHRACKSAWRESNPLVHLGGVVPGPLGHRRVRNTKARAQGVEPTASGLEPHCSPRSTSLAKQGKELTLPKQAVPAGLEPAPVWLTASSTTIVLRVSNSKRTAQESNLNESDAHLAQRPMTSAPGRTPTLSSSSGGWGRTSGLRVFSAALSPAELHRKQRDAGRN